MFDEIEKAHPDVFNLLLQILDDGRLTDSRGRAVNFKNTIIIMTSNIGQYSLENSSKLGFAVSDDEEKDRYDRIKDTVMEEMKKAFRPEFLNRLDDTIVFSNLTKAEIRQIVEIMLVDLLKRLRGQEIKLDITEEVKDFLRRKAIAKLMEQGRSAESFKRKIEDPIAEEILTGQYKADDTIKLQPERQKN